GGRRGGCRRRRSGRRGRGGTLGRRLFLGCVGRLAEAGRQQRLGRLVALSEGGDGDGQSRAAGEEQEPGALREKAGTGLSQEATRRQYSRERVGILANHSPL